MVIMLPHEYIKKYYMQTIKEDSVSIPNVGAVFNFLGKLKKNQYVQHILCKVCLLQTNHE